MNRLATTLRELIGQQPADQAKLDALISQTVTSTSGRIRRPANLAAIAANLKELGYGG